MTRPTAFDNVAIATTTRIKAAHASVLMTALLLSSVALGTTGEAHTLIAALVVTVSD